MTTFRDLAASLAPLLARVRVDITAKKSGDGRQAWTREELTPERLLLHVAGKEFRGVSQIPAGSSATRVAVLDFDSHGGETPWPEMVRVADEVGSVAELMHGLRPVAWRSSGGRGVHLYFIWDEPQDAYSVREALRHVLADCGLKPGTKGVIAGEVELFPKQDEVPAEGFGNQVILPLAGKSVPLVRDLMTGVLEPAGKLEAEWVTSDAVELRERPARPERRMEQVAGHEELRRLLDYVPNTGDDELDYDEWWRVIAAIHHETGGSDDGLELAHAFSAKSLKYAPEFLDDRIWPFVRSEGRASVIGLGSLQRIAARYGWVGLPPSADVFDDVSELDPRPPIASADVGEHERAVALRAQVAIHGLPLPEIERVTMVTSPVVDLTSDVAQSATLAASMALTAKATVHSPPPPPVRRGIPEAHHLTTDQANANRIVKAFGRQVFVAAGRWYVWDGKRWLADEADVYRYGCQLSDLIRTEARDVVARAAVLDLAAQQTAAGVSAALMKWAVKSEMKGTIEAAIGLARKMLTIDADLLDKDPFALNVANGIVDLRTGVLRRHNPDELITKLVPVRYVPGASCDGWVGALRSICQGNAELVGFLQRWFGYCLTGSVDEQCFVVHWGGGANGKSTVLGLMADTMGDYAGTAAPGLLAASGRAGGSDRHPTEIAALMGKRMVTAHESGEGVVLREDFVKQATGGDRLEARFMRGDFFGFAPTHKLQLLTNHKPHVKGQDRGIWRRVLLVPYGASFGTGEMVARGVASAVADTGLAERLKGELEGVLAWRVQGAVRWHEGGLQAPAVVREASAAYKAEQDRVGQFVEECCERPGAGELAAIVAACGDVGEAGAEGGGKGLGVALVEAGWAVPLVDVGMSGGVYPAFVGWCKESGVFASSKARFLDDLLRVVGAGGTVERRAPVENGRRRRMTMVPGLRLLET